MSTQNSREAREDDAKSTEPACETSLTGSSTEWQERPAAAYPPGYPRLCTDECCFGQHVPDEAWNGDGTADYDHTQVADTLVASTRQGAKRKYHLAEGHEVER